MVGLLTSGRDLLSDVAGKDGEGEQSLLGEGDGAGLGLGVSWYLTGDAMGIDLLATAIGGDDRGGAFGGEEIKGEELVDTATVGGLVRGAGEGLIFDEDKDDTGD